MSNNTAIATLMERLKSASSEEKYLVWNELRKANQACSGLGRQEASAQSQASHAQEAS